MDERIRIEADQRADGSFHLKSANLPGFHFIVGADEPTSAWQNDLTEALTRFLQNRHRGAARKGMRITEHRVYDLEPA